MVWLTHSDDQTQFCILLWLQWGWNWRGGLDTVTVILTMAYTHTGNNQISSSGLNFTQVILLVSTLPALKFCSRKLDGWTFLSGDSVWIEVQLLFLVGVETFLLQELGDSLTEKEDLLIDSLLGALAGFGCGSGEEDLRFHPMFNLSLSLKRQVTLKKN